MVMAAESRSLLERISSRLAGAEHSWPREKFSPQPLSPVGDLSPQPPSCAQELVLTDSEENTPPKQLSQQSHRAKQPDSKCTSNLASSVQEKPRPVVTITDSSDEEFEKFLTQLKTPRNLSNKVLDKPSKSLKDFIVESDDDDDFDSVFSKSEKTSKTGNGIKKSDSGPERSQRNIAAMRWDSPVFISDSDDDDSIVIKSTWRDRHRQNHNSKTDNVHRSKSVRANGKENTPETNSLDIQATEGWAAGRQTKFCTPGSSDEEFECLMDRIKSRIKNETPGSTASKIRPRSAATEPIKVPCFDLTNTKARKPKSQTDVLSSPYFCKDKEPVHSVERTSADKTGRMCKVEGCFLQDLSCSTSIYVKSFKQKKHELTVQLYRLYNKTIFEQKLPENLEITWNKKMRKTAGYCVTGQKRPTLERYARIELSEKVCDSADRLRDTLIHEICHAATWLINGVRDGHGQYWKFYARKATLIHPELPMVSRCHSYEINYKFTYECSRCKNTIGRHSKSLDTDKFVCALCKGKLVLQTTTRKDGSPSVNQLTPFAKFVKDNYGSAKKEMTGMSHAEVMRKLSADFSTKTKISN
ncbi:germ cell nuclear acidic protein [Dendropsophus ebraccatus]|uniref:germ cell nuclear acidic protein n=1 Tax=Dendropsophus ebraccatus TaxID=150705 RepID=UPI00383185AA